MAAKRRPYSLQFPHVAALARDREVAAVVGEKLVTDREVDRVGERAGGGIPERVQSVAVTCDPSDRSSSTIVRLSCSRMSATTGRAAVTPDTGSVARTLSPTLT